MRLLKEIRHLIGNYHLKSGVYHYYRSEYTQAVEFLRKALGDERTAEPDRQRARHYLTLSLMDSARKLESGGDLDGAIEDLRKAAEVSPHFPDIHARLGGLLERQSSMKQAIEEYAKATEHNPNYLEAHVSLGLCLLREGLLEQAGEAFTRALELKRGRIEGPCQEGLRLLALGERDRAAEHFYEAFLVVPGLCDEYIEKAVRHLRAEDFEEALLDFDRALELNPRYPDAHNYRGIALCELNRPDEAIEAFRRSAALSPSFVVPRLNLAFAHVRAGQYEDAEAELKAILERDSTEQVAGAALAELQSESRSGKRRNVRGSVR